MSTSEFNILKTFSDSLKLNLEFWIKTNLYDQMKFVTCMTNSNPSTKYETNKHNFSRI